MDEAASDTLGSSHGLVREQLIPFQKLQEMNLLMRFHLHTGNMYILGFLNITEDIRGRTFQQNNEGGGQCLFWFCGRHGSCMFKSPSFPIQTGD